jgi:hypothetical protein
VICGQPTKSADLFMNIIKPFLTVRQRNVTYLLLGTHSLSYEGYIYHNPHLTFPLTKGEGTYAPLSLWERGRG